MDQITNGTHKLNTIVVEDAGSQITSDSLFKHYKLKEIEAAIDSLNTVKKILMQMGIGKWYIGHYGKETWKAPLPFYAWKCGDCGAIAFGYPQGYKNDLYCNRCSTSEL